MAGGGVTPPDVPPPKRGYHPSPLAVWSRYCPLGRHFDQLDSDEEDLMDASLAYALQEALR